MDNAQPTPDRAAIADDIAPEALITRYLTGPALVRGAIAGMDADQLHARPIPDKLSTHEVVTHIVDSESALGERIKRAIAGEEPPITQGGRPELTFDPERDLDADLEMLENAREQLAEELGKLLPDVWENVAMRRPDRKVTVRQLLMLMTRHLENHVAAIEEKRRALGL